MILVCKKEQLVIVVKSERTDEVSHVIMSYIDEKRDGTILVLLLSIPELLVLNSF